MHRKATVLCIKETIMKRNTLVLLTGVLLLGGLFGVTAAVSAADTVEPDQQASNFSLDFSDQTPDSGTVTVDNVNSNGTDATVVITYNSGPDKRIVGLTTGTYADESIQISVGTSGFPGPHTAHILPTANVSSNTTSTGEISDTTANEIVENESAQVSLDVGNNGRVARDTTGDGLLNDVNGDANVDILDVQALFTNLDSATVQQNAPHLDFAGLGDSRVNVFDIQGLYSDVTTPEPSLAFSDQEVQSTDSPDPGTPNFIATVEDVDSAGEEMVIVITHNLSGAQQVVGIQGPGIFDGTNQTVGMWDEGTVPGEHTAHLIHGEEFGGYQPGDILSNETAALTFGEATANLTVPFLGENPPE